MRRLLFLICLVSCLALVSYFPLPFSSAELHPDLIKPVGGNIKTLVIDPGHGGKDPGAVGKNHYEKDLALKVALELRRIVQENMPGIKVVMTREDDTFIELHRRGEIAKEAGGDFFVSIHCNALDNRSKYGTETYVLGVNNGQENYETIIAENESILFEENYGDMYGGFDPTSPEGFIYFKLLKNVFRSESVRMAEKIEKQFKTRLGRHSRGVKQAPFVVLYQCGMPAILSEIGFISNREEEKYLASEEGQIYIASSIYRAIKEYNMELDIPGPRP
ncbi:MAG: N-acetylmuramoyl-L-alanine amidase [Bacteroidia bacterium]|nr:N-acetylmuramoyl-L-alanine amidase [Bacteroidia bacterium]